jgi:hypothetical protein
MQWFECRSAVRLTIAALALLSLAQLIGQAIAVDTEDAVTVSVEDASAKVGDKTTVVAKITPREGYRLAEDYRNRVISLSAEDNEVEFDNKVVRGLMQDGSLVFKIRVTPKTPGSHAINGVLRFGFVNSLDGDYHLDIKWVPLIATVTGTQ